MTYRSADLGNLSDPLAELIYIVLSRQTREAVYQKVYGDLRRRWPTWVGVLSAPVAEVAAVLAPAGLQAQRAVQIQTLLSVVREDNQWRRCGPYANSSKLDLTLDYLRTMDDLEVETYLRLLPGVGPKTARCVMSYSLGRQSFAVDTHVRRIFRHLRVVESTGIKADHDPFELAVPPELRLPLHINLVHHGRAVCSNTNPACGDCVLVSWCANGRRRAAKSRPEAPVAVDLFSGAGGLSTGFQEQGFRIALAVEQDRNAAQSYRANHPGVPVIEEDVRTLSGAAIREAAAGADQVSVVLAGPPCQGYSAAGRRQSEDVKNTLYREVTRLAAEIDADFVVMENVLGARMVAGTQFEHAILRSLRARGYRAQAHVLNALDFDVPQRRRRLVFIARRSGDCESPPAGPTDEPTEPIAGFLRRSLEDLPAFGPGVEAEYVTWGVTHLLNGSTMRHSARVISKIRAIPPGKGPISYRRLDPDAARTLIAGHRALPVHPWLDRTISVREAARIQGFRDDFVFCGPRAEQPLQVANAVPPPMAAGIARAVLEAGCALPRASTTSSP